MDATAKLVQLELGPRAPQAKARPTSGADATVGRLSQIDKEELDAFLKVKPGAGLAMSTELPKWTKVGMNGRSV